MLIRNAEIEGQHLDVRCAEGRIAEIGPALAASQGEPELEARGGALMRGLHDHHIHLFSLAAAMASIPCGPPQVEDRNDLAKSLARATPRDGWLRGTGYFESVAGSLDRDTLDAIVPDRPVRIQHRSGSMWFLNSRAITALGLEPGEGSERRDERRADRPEGLELDPRGRPTGRLFRADDWLRGRLPRSSRPQLAAVGRRLARFGVTSVTDATPSNGLAEVEAFRDAQRCGALPQRVRLMGGPALNAFPGEAGIRADARKVLLDEPALPDLDALVQTIREAHAADRGIAIHTVTRSEIHFALAAIDVAGAHPLDRLEHASIAPPEALDQVRRLGVRIVTQPNFIGERGDAYRQHVPASDQPHLYRVRSWIEHDVVLAAGTDAPFGDPDPWRAMQAAVTRQTASGEVLGAAERVTPETALELFSPDRLAGHAAVRAGLRRSSPLQMVVGAPADLCLLDLPWREAREALSSEHVSATLRGGELVGVADEA